MNVKALHPELGRLGFSETIEERFWRNVAIIPYDRGCWLWAGGLNDRGYGLIGKGKVGAGTTKAHIVSWIIHHGEVPAGKCVLHACDVPNCVNPNHLWLGTKGDNNRDAAQKGRNRRGETHSFSKLTTKDVLAMRALWPSVSLTEIARRFGVKWAAVWKIVHRINWRHV